MRLPAALSKVNPKTPGTSAPETTLPSESLGAIETLTVAPAVNAAVAVPETDFAERATCRSPGVNVTMNGEPTAGKNADPAKMLTLSAYVPSVLVMYSMV